MWSLVADHPDLLATRAEWEESLDVDYPVAARHIVATREISKTWACGRPGTDGCFRRVIEHGRDRLVGVCPVGRCDRIPLQRADVVLHRLDLRSLCREMCLALGLDQGRLEAVGDDPAGSSPASYRLGACTIDGRGIALYFTRRTSAEQILPILEKMRLRDPSDSAVLLVPVDDAVDMVVRSAARQASVFLVPLARVASVADEGLQLDLSQFLKVSTEDADHGPAADRPTFRRSSNQVWEVRYKGRETTFLRDSLAPRCVHELLSRPHKGIHCLALRAVAAGAFSENAISDDRARDEGLLPGPGAARVRDGIDVDAVLTPEVIADYRQRYLNIEGDIAAAEADPSLQHLLPKLRDARQWLLDELSAGTNDAKKPRIKRASKNALDVIRRAVNAMKESLRDAEPELVAHFERALSIGAQCVYQPELDVPWVLWRHGTRKGT